MLSNWFLKFGCSILILSIVLVFFVFSMIFTKPTNQLLPNFYLCNFLLFQNFILFISKLYLVGDTCILISFMFVNCLVLGYA